MGTNQAVKEIEVDDAMVVAAATDINAVLSPKPLLDLKKPGEKLQKEIEELFPNIIKGDALSGETWVTLIALGWKATEAPKIEKQAPTSPAIPKAVPATKAQPTSAKAVKASRMPHKASKPVKAASVPAKPAKPSKKAAKTVGRMESIAVVLRKGSVTDDQVARMANEIYVKRGGKSNEKASASFYGFAKQILRALNLILIKDGKISLT